MDEIDIDPATAAGLTAAYKEIDRLFVEGISRPEPGWEPPATDEIIQPAPIPRPLVDATLLRNKLGRSLIDLREQMGERTFKLALAKACPGIPWEDAEEYMNASLDSPIARAQFGD